MPDFKGLPIARYRFTYRVSEAIHTQLYAGSALRGSFGHALRQLACITKAKTCDDCSLIAQCPYPLVFSPHEIPRSNELFTTVQQIPVPYLIEPPPIGVKTYHKDEQFSFNIVLMGESIGHLALIILAWRRALLRGLGKYEGKGELISVVLLTDVAEQIVYSEEAPFVVAHMPAIQLPEFRDKEDIHLQFLTPLRIQKDKKILGAKDISAKILLRNIVRRVSFVSQFHLGGALEFNVHETNSLADSLLDERRLAWLDWSRFSSRQQQKMDLGGVTGHWLLRDVPGGLMPFIYIGQWLHVGKETSFGLGHYTIVDQPWKPADRESF
jgi:hypothetical protein